MMSKYSVAFLIPNNTTRFLGDDGWEFSSEYRISAEVEALLKRELSATEIVPEFSSYEARNLKVGVFKDSAGKIESVYFRFYEGVKPVIPSFLAEVSKLECLEFFIPSQ